MTDVNENCRPGEEGPVTVSISRKVKPNREADYEAWLKGIGEVARTFEGQQSVNILRPSSQTNGEYVVIYHFDNYENCRKWEESAERQAWVDKLSDLVEGDATYSKQTGLEFWFDLPTLPSAVKPSPHKMALTLVVVVFSIIYPFQFFVGPHLNFLPLWAKVLLVVTAQVLLMTYVVMPRVTHLLRHWLFKA